MSRAFDTKSFSQWHNTWNLEKKIHSLVVTMELTIWGTRTFLEYPKWWTFLELKTIVVTEQSALWRVGAKFGTKQKKLAPPPTPAPPNPPLPSSRLLLIFSLSFSFSFVPAGFRFLVGVWHTLAPTSSTSTTWHSLIINYYYYPGGFFFSLALFWGPFFFSFVLSFGLPWRKAQF